MPPSIPVVVAGALGRMGAEVIKAVVEAPDCTLVGAVDNTPGKRVNIGLELGLVNRGGDHSRFRRLSLCCEPVGTRFQQRRRVGGFHPASVVYEHTRASIAYGVHPVIGTTGLSTEQLSDLSQFSAKASIGGAVIPNFSVGMVLLQQAAAAAARFYDHSELTELHHNRKADAPSGTCIKTAELMEELGKSFNLSEVDEHESLEGSRGGRRESGLRLHPAAPRPVAHQEEFGAPGETYTLRHDTIDRSAYMPGVLLTVRKVDRPISGLRP